MVIYMFNISDAKYVADLLNVSFEQFTIDEFLDGINVELEHGKINPLTNVTNDDIVMTAKIALAHLKEFPNYYNKDYGIKHFEKEIIKK